MENNPFKQFEYKPRAAAIPLPRSDAIQLPMASVLEQKKISVEQIQEAPVVKAEPKAQDLKLSYIYLIREREHLEAGRDIYKFGRSCQLPENYISRLRQYKRGSEIIMVLQCTDAVDTESRIRDIFKDEFMQHKDGHEHYYGDRTKMMKIIWKQVMRL